MKLVFTKDSRSYDRLEGFRQDTEPESIACPTQGISPHNVVHHGVEHTLQTRGFLGRVKDGERLGFRMAPLAQSDSISRLFAAKSRGSQSAGNPLRPAVPCSWASDKRRFQGL